nr:CRISPR-associated protein Cas4 [Calothrix sp. PCC 7507]
MLVWYQIIFVQYFSNILENPVSSDEEWEELFLESEELGLRGRLDALRTRDGQTIPYEHKRGRCYRDENKQPFDSAQGKPQAWESDRLQILAYAYLLESAWGITVKEGRIRYHADNVLVHVPVDDAGRTAVKEAIQQARILRQSTHRPPVTNNERLCARCSLAPVCLPEEAQLAHDKEWQPIRLFPEDDERQVIHILEPGTCVRRTGEQIKITRRNQPVETVPARQVGNLAALYFSALPCLISPEMPKELHFADRNRRPPQDRFNAMLSFGMLCY